MVSIEVREHDECVKPQVRHFVDQRRLLASLRRVFCREDHFSCFFADFF